MFLEQLAKSAIIQITCEKTGIGKSTIYRWREQNKDFDKAIKEAMREGKSLVTDLAESQLISAIKDKNIPAITLWLKTHHPEYRNRLEVTATIQEELTPEQEAVVREALRLASITMPKNITVGNEKVEVLPTIFPEQKSDQNINNDNQKIS